MRKILLATTAFVAVAFVGAGSASAASSPISLNVGGYDDFVFGFYHEANGVTPALETNNHDFENEFKLNFDAMGKASNGIEYGANIGLWNGPEATNLWQGGVNTVELNSAYVWMSGAFGKVLLGDEHGASDLFVYAPTVGEGQVDGRYQDFVNPLKLARFMPSGIDNTEHSTKVTYYTPKVGNAANKVQLGVSYLPNMYNYGQSVVVYNSATALGQGLAASPYQDVIKGAAEYWGNWHPVHVALSGQILNGQGSHVAASGTTLESGLVGTVDAGVKAMDFTAWGVGGQVGIDQVAGLTLGGSYMDNGNYGAVHGQNKAQNDWTVGGKYEFDKVGVGVSYLGGIGYDNLLSSAGDAAATTGQSVNYVDNFNAWGAGATYTWFPGLTSSIDGVMFTQQVLNQTDHNDGYVLLLSQKLTF